MEEGRPDNNVYDFIVFMKYDLCDDHDVDYDDEDSGGMGSRRRGGGTGGRGTW